MNKETVKPNKVYDMTHIDSVLLPESSESYFIWLGAQSQEDLIVDILASNAFNKIAGLFFIVASALFMIL